MPLPEEIQQELVKNTADGQPFSLQIRWPSSARDLFGPAIAQRQNQIPYGLLDTSRPNLKKVLTRFPFSLPKGINENTRP
jgi:hypothetical protein